VTAVVIRPLVRLCLLLPLAFFLAADGWADPFSFGRIVLSQRSSLATTNVYYDAQVGADFATRVSRPQGEPYLRHEMVFLKGERDDPQRFSRLVTVFATERNQPYFMEFEGSSDYREPPPERYKLETLQDCRKSAEKLNGIVRLAEGRGYTGLTVFIVLDPLLPEDVRVESLEAIERWTAATAVPRGAPGRTTISPHDFAFQLDFKTFAEVLGPRFRGAVVSCSVSDVGLQVGWQTRFLDLALAATVFNLDPE
jgi:hypothetical protein